MQRLGHLSPGFLPAGHHGLAVGGPGPLSVQRLLDCSHTCKCVFIKLPSVLKLGMQPASATCQALLEVLSSPNPHNDPVISDYSSFMGDAPGAQRG